MRIIVITSPDFIAGEVSLINTLFDGGINRVHIRKPQASADEVRRLIEGIESKWHSRLSLHDHHHLALEYGCGIHLNGRNPYPPKDARKDTVISASCHSTEEVEQRKTQCDYVFMSPIFNSISKQGYAAAYSQDELMEASTKGIIDNKVIALGGITPKHIPYLERLGFGGAAFLGHVWQHAHEGLFDSPLDTIFNGYVKPEH
ncbi:MAG: thiamine phosphate synthase [Prevotella sp.]